METTTVVVILVLCVAGAGAYVYMHQKAVEEKTKVEEKTFASSGAPFAFVGGKLLNRDGSPATKEDTDAHAEAFFKSHTAPGISLSSLKFW
jgi:hypothetical protein